MIIKFITGALLVFFLAACSTTPKDTAASSGSGSSSSSSDVSSSGSEDTSSESASIEPGSQEDLIVNVGDRVFFNYDSSELVTRTNVISSNSNGRSVDGIVELFLEADNINFPPLAEDQEVTTSQNTSIEITLVATDIDNDPLTFSIANNPINGSITISNNIFRRKIKNILGI